MTSNFFDMLEKAQTLYKDRRAERLQNKIARDERFRAIVLDAKFHAVGRVQLPLPSLYALDWMNAYFGDLDNVNLEKPRHLAAVVWILRHQEFAHDLPGADPDIERKIGDVASQIGIHEMPEYVICITEIFERIKKKLNRSAISHLEKILELMDQYAGDLLSSASAESSTSPPSTSTEK